MKPKLKQKVEKPERQRTETSGTDCNATHATKATRVLNKPGEYSRF